MSKNPPNFGKLEAPEPPIIILDGMTAYSVTDPHTGFEMAILHFEACDTKVRFAVFYEDVAKIAQILGEFLAEAMENKTLNS